MKRLSNVLVLVLALCLLASCGLTSKQRLAMANDTYLSYVQTVKEIAPRLSSEDKKALAIADNVAFAALDKANQAWKESRDPSSVSSLIDSALSALGAYARELNKRTPTTLPGD